jgi:pimeloyl-ACP methyl ester carboxylesterase
MRMKHHIIYLPGLGDDKPFQRLLVGWWRALGVRVQYHYIGWSDPDEPFNAKLQRVLDSIDNLARPDHRVSLIGTSAGASMALNAYNVRRDKIHRVVLVCGKIQHVETVSEDYYRTNPPLRASLERLGGSVESLTANDKAKMLILQPKYDNVVAVEDMLIPGVAVLPMRTSGHAKSIAAAMTIYSPKITQFLKS